MERERKPQKRAYRSPRRAAQAARTREAIVRAAQRLFEQRGWSGTTLTLVASGAGVSLKTVEAVFGTKAVLLQATVDYAIRGDLDPSPIPQRDSVARMEAAPDAASMLRLHAKHLRAINTRSARIAAAVEQAAASDETVAALWRQMNHNRRYAVRWAARTLLAKPGHKPGLTRQHAETAFWVALDWATYRTLTDQAGLTAARYEAWLATYYRDVFLRSP
jgi:AcrR family transcriptional regulator